jgi:hypothetical protein
LKPVVATLALIPFLLLSSCGRRTSTVPHASDSGDSESSPAIRKLAWSDPVPYTWGVVPPQNQQPPSDTTIDLNHLESARITSGVDQPIAQPIETSPCDFNHIDTTIDMEKLASVPIRYKTSILGQPQRRTVTPPRIKDGATAAILDFAEEQNLIRGTFAFRAAQDSDGRMWFGTNAGLVMFDGVSSYNYTKAQGLAGSGIWSVMINPDSTIWAGGFMGLDLLDLS